MAHKLAWAASLLAASLGTLAFEAPIRDTDYTRQLCSGMYSSGSTYINVTFDQGSQGQLAMVIYEWGDYKYLGKVTSEEEEWLPVCTSFPSDRAERVSRARPSREHMSAPQML